MIELTIKFVTGLGLYFENHEMKLELREASNLRENCLIANDTNGKMYIFPLENVLYFTITDTTK